VKIILDTNVFISGIFFKGPPYEILNSWRNKKHELVISKEIYDEYKRVAEELSRKYPIINIVSLLELVLINSKLVKDSKLPKQICNDPDDDKFIACALTSNSKIIVSGDKILLEVSGYKGINIISPRDFVNKYIKKKR
jgi:putative PIN family toxin of toxin-antitoxin system